MNVYIFCFFVCKSSSFVLPRHFFWADGMKGAEVEGGRGGGVPDIKIGHLGWSSFSPSEMRSPTMDSEASDRGNIMTGGPLQRNSLWCLPTQCRKY